MSKLIGNLSRGKMFIISAPSGTGKTTLVDIIAREFPNYVTKSVSCTTRPKRDGEVDKKDYIFLSEKDFEEKKIRGEFLEWVNIFGYRYGTLNDRVEANLNGGKHTFLVIDVNGAIDVKKNKRDAILVFIHPPSFRSLVSRIENRNMDHETEIKKRLGRAKFEIEESKNYDYHIINDNLQIAYQVLKSIVIAEEHKSRGIYVKQQIDE